jgi:hypothetical protein
MVKDETIPAQPFAEGVIVIVPEMGSFVVFVAVKVGIFPLPLAAKPIEVLLFAHVKVVPATGPESVVTGITTPVQEVKFAMMLTVGVG